MRFKEFVTEQRPTVTTSSKEEVIAWIKQHASNYVKNSLDTNNYIARGVPSAVQYSIGDSSTFKRKAAHTKNYVNLFLETSPRWKKFPSRVSAYICSNGLFGAENYSGSDDPYLVIPADDAHVGVCPEEDFWISFERGFAKAKLNQFGNIDELNRMITMIGDVNKIKFSEVDSDEFHEQLEEILVEDIMKANKSPAALQLVQAMHALNVENLNDLLEIVLGPELNKFQQYKAHSVNVRTGTPFECWVEGKCAFIKVNKKSLEDTIEELKNAV